jgi:hypothetical protein
MVTQDQPLPIDMRIPSPPELESLKAIHQPSQANLTDAWRYLALGLYAAWDLVSPQLRLPLGMGTEPTFDDYNLSILEPRVFSELEQLRELRSQVQNELFELRRLKDDLEILQPRVVMIREVDEGMAELEITHYLEEHGHADTGELVEKLGIDIDIILKVIQHLKAEGKVEGVGSH